MENGIRIQKVLSEQGIASRRKVEEWITQGKIKVNGRPAVLGQKINPNRDVVAIDGERVYFQKSNQKYYIMLHKPRGYVTTMSDELGRKCVAELVEDVPERVYPIGRLDKDSEGMLLFTNDGDLTKQLTHPAFRKKKIYQVSLDKPLTRADMDRIAEGITLEDGEIFADEISYVKDNKQEVGIEIHSGRNRIVRRIFEFLGYTVTKLDRVYYAGLTKKNLKRGAWRFLSREEVERLKSGQYE